LNEVERRELQEIKGTIRHVEINGVTSEVGMNGSTLNDSMSDCLQFLI
jgi:hypothetical protein